MEMIFRDFTLIEGIFPGILAQDMGYTRFEATTLMKLTVLFCRRYKTSRTYLVYKIEGTRRYKCIANVCYFLNKSRQSRAVRSYKHYELVGYK